MREDLREIGPHVIIAPPRFWEAMCSEYQMKIGDAGRVKAAVARMALSIGRRVRQRGPRPQGVGPGLGRPAGLAHWGPSRPPRDRRGGPGAAVPPPARARP